MGNPREWLLATVTVALTIATCLLLAELVLRFLPVASAMYTAPVTARNPVFRFAPNRDFVYSRDWDMALANRGHVNNAGFVNDQDYRKDGELPLLAVIGDSMIEAAMVPYRDTLQGRLAELLAGKLRVYSFATAGAPLSQYLIWARHAVREYGAQALIINVVGNDFDESHSAYKTSPGFWHYVPDVDGTLRLRLFEYRPGRLRDVVVASALARYLLFNMQVTAHWVGLRSFLLDRPASAALENADGNAGRTANARFARGGRCVLPRPARIRGFAAIADSIHGRRISLSCCRCGPSRRLFRSHASSSYWRRPSRSAITPSTSIGRSLNVIAAPASISNSYVTVIGAPSVMQRSSMQ